LLQCRAILNYQLDIWGKMAAASKAAKARLSALESTKNAVKITVASEVSKAYFNLLSLDNKLSIAQKLVNLNEKLEQIKLRQLKTGIIDNSELQRFKSQSYLAKSHLLNLKQKLVSQENALAVILGRDVSSSLISRERDLVSFKINDLPKEFPSKLLLKRPDIMAAEKMLEAAKYQVKVARASYFPEISLNAIFGLTSQHSGNLFEKKSRAKLIDGRISLPLLDFGKTSANVDYALVDKSQHMLEYQHVIRIAFAEGITSLAANKNARDNFIEHKENTKAVEINFNISKRQLQAGSIDYLMAIDSEKNYLNSKSMLIDAAKQRLDSMVDVYKAFGGNIKAK
jgi:multidrug efflux system outer membrane protein